MNCVRITSTYDCDPPSNQDINDLIYRKRALRDAILCMGWIRIMSVVFYITMFVFVSENSEGPVSSMMQVMIWIAVPFIILCAITLFFGAIEEKRFALEISMWLCTFIAAYNTLLGLIGAVYFIRNGKETVHFVLAVVFGFITLSILIVICHDFVIVYTYRNLLKTSESPKAQSFTSEDDY